jgi:hypothetical protein
MKNIDMLKISTAALPEELTKALSVLAGEYPLYLTDSEGDVDFRPVSAKDVFSKVSRIDGRYVVEYSTLSGALRGIGSVLAEIECEERTSFLRLGIMLDVSRNMVMKVEHFKKWLRRLALSGCNQLQLYCEDTYQLPGEPFFGIYRAPYTLEELQEMDAYADSLGIELIGCIQTLAHLEQILQHQSYAEIRDNDKIMLVDHPGTEALVRKMIAFWSQALKSRRLHIGMDEAHGLGRGRFQTLHGPEGESTLMTRHLKLVAGICKEYGVAPLIWSDMFFRMTNPGHVYYDLESPFPPGINGEIDPDTTLVYWDYYHRDRESYRKMILRHRELGKEPLVASGIWTWSRMWYDHRKTMETATPCIEICREEKIKELSFTMWGDDGAYCHYDSALAGIIRCADISFGADDENVTAERFAAICGGDYFARTAVGDIHGETGGIADDDSVEIFPSMVLWDDPLLGIYYSNCKCAHPDFDRNYLAVLEKIQHKILPFEAEKDAGNMAYAAALLRALTGKLQLRQALEKAYYSNDKAALELVARENIPETICRMEQVAAMFRENWLECARANGMERIQTRFAGQICRLQELQQRIGEFLTGKVSQIDELEHPLDRNLPPQRMNFYHRVSSGSNHI